MADLLSELGGHFPSVVTIWSAWGPGEGDGHGLASYEERPGRESLEEPSRGASPKPYPEGYWASERGQRGGKTDKVCPLPLLPFNSKIL